MGREQGAVAPAVAKAARAGGGSVGVGPRDAGPMTWRTPDAGGAAHGDRGAGPCPPRLYGPAALERSPCCGPWDTGTSIPAVCRSGRGGLAAALSRGCCGVGVVGHGRRRCARNGRSSQRRTNRTKAQREIGPSLITSSPPPSPTRPPAHTPAESPAGPLLCFVLWIATRIARATSRAHPGNF